MKRARRTWVLWIGVGISVVALILALLGIDPQEVKAAFTQARYIYLVPAGLSLPKAANPARSCSKCSPCYLVSHDRAAFTRFENRQSRRLMKCSG